MHMVPTCIDDSRAVCDVLLMSLKCTPPNSIVLLSPAWVELYYQPIPQVHIYTLYIVLKWMDFLANESPFEVNT